MHHRGHPHPLTLITDEIVDSFISRGFTVALGPELEDQWHNFDALNVPPDHPARDMQDTFFIKNSEKVLRTHTSPMQVRYLETHAPPCAIVVPGKVFRQEATDATHEVQFHQVEGLYVDRNVSLAHLKGVLQAFIHDMFGKDVEMRLRPGYFPFVEPGVEVDLRFNGRWLEVLGAGMVHPRVLEQAGVDPSVYSGCAFGIGVDRLAMMRYGIPDVRLFYNGDMRLVTQF